MVSDLAEALRNELLLSTGKEPFVDYERLRGGDFFESTIATALCKSACLVVVYIPTYFDQSHTYCAREFRAMEQLESERLSVMSVDERQHGLIIPAVFRGLQYLPPYIKDRRHVYDFEAFTMADRRMAHHTKFQPQIREIAEVVSARYMKLSRLIPDPCVECDEFALPTDVDIRDWLAGLHNAPQPFPR